VKTLRLTPEAACSVTAQPGGRPTKCLDDGTCDTYLASAGENACAHRNHCLIITRDWMTCPEKMGDEIRIRESAWVSQAGWHVGSNLGG
jgi:hypothetical protein